MAKQQHFITVCICTLNRTEQLRRLLGELDRQQTEGQFGFCVVVADNDGNQSAREVVLEAGKTAAHDVTYAVEPRRNIALVRNRALAHARGDLVAFIDDDEIPSPGWLSTLFKAYLGSGADGVLGPVLPRFEQTPPTWVTRGKFFERPAQETGSRMGATDMRTGNVLFRRDIIAELAEPFRAEFGTGSEDTDFFWRMSQKGCVFTWCNEAVVHETIPPSRCRRGYLLKRALLRGNNSLKYPACRTRNVVKSLVALPVYGVLLPFLLVAGGDRFMKYLIRFCDHAGRVMALLRLVPFRGYVS